MMGAMCESTRGLGRVVTREGACVREREGARINAMHVSVNHTPSVPKFLIYLDTDVSNTKM